MYATIEDARLFYSENDNFMHEQSDTAKFKFLRSSKLGANEHSEVEYCIKMTFLNNVKLKIGIKQ